MRGKQSVIEELNDRYLGLDIRLHFLDNHTFVGGASSTGKSFLYRILMDLSNLDDYDYIKTFNYADRKKDILSELKNCYHKLIVIDNADIILDDECRHQIAFNFSNQYLIFGRNARGFLFTPNNLAMVKFDNYCFSLDYLSEMNKRVLNGGCY